MRQGQQNRRGRGRNNNHSHGGGGGGGSHGNSNNRRGQNPLSRNFESNGPGVKIRGNASHVAEKYMSLARDAQSSGDSVMAENYLQHAEHYNRIIMAAQQPADGTASPGMPQRPRQLPAEFGLPEDDMDGDGDELQNGGNVASHGQGYAAPADSYGQGGQGGGASPQGGNGYQSHNTPGQGHGYGQQPQQSRGYGNRGEGQRGDGQRGDRFPRDRDNRDRDNRDRDNRDRDGNQQRMNPRHEMRPDQGRQDHARSEQGRPDHGQGRQDRPRHDQPRREPHRRDEGRRDEMRRDDGRRDDFGRQPQPVVDQLPPASADGFSPGINPLPAYLAQPPVIPSMPVAHEPEPMIGAEPGRISRSPAEGGAGEGTRRERAPRPGVGEEGYRAPRRRRLPASVASVDDGPTGHSAGDGGSDGAQAAPGHADIDAPARRKVEPENSSE